MHNTERPLGADDMPMACIPAPAVLWRSFRFWTWILFALAALAALPDILVQYWFNQSLGYQTIFWTNFWAQAVLVVGFGCAVAAAIVVPVVRHGCHPGMKRAALHVGVWAGLIGGVLFARNYEQFLLAVYGVPFGVTDPVFGNDVGFYVFTLPALRLLLAGVEMVLLLSVAAVLVARYSELRERGVIDDSRLPLSAKVRLFASPPLQVLVLCYGVTVALWTFLARYGLLFKDNEPSGVRAGAEYLDVVGVFSALNFVSISSLVALGVTVATVLFLRRTYRSDEFDGEWRRSIRVPVGAAVVLIGVELCFFIALTVRDRVFVTPNEPYVQLEYIQRHIDATLRAYDLDQVDVHEWRLPEESLSTRQLLASETVRNAPFLPSWVSYLEEPPDVQHYERIKVAESTMVFGPMLQTYEQQQQLRPYYDFLSVDGVRYSVDGRKRMFVSAVRELPSVAMIGHQEWLKYWGSAALLLTHGMGLVMSPANVIDEMGSPEYVASGVPPRLEDPVFEHEPRVYFGEGAKDDYVLTNVRGLKEFDYATDQSRAEFVYPEGLQDGIGLDSFFKRLVFALHTKDVTAFLFSRYIEPDKTRVHIRRTPMRRASSIAPFLFLDSNPYAFISDKQVLWMINGLTTSSEYPYSYREVLGDKADERAVEDFPERLINYAEDSVKVTVNAFSGEVNFYKIANAPVVDSWARIYPDLFRPMEDVPESVEEQFTYPLQWFHIQFDDIYKRYHQTHPIQFYNVEDLWDDADETIGSLGRGLSGFGTSDQMTFSYEGYNLLLDPVDLPEGVNIGEPGELQYALLMPFTPEAGRNLRALIIALQDPGSYGRLISLQIPQGTFVPGPEQVDAYIDNDRPVHQQVTMWIRHASEVMRGNTLLLPVRGDLMYLEAIWVSSLQNQLPQLKLFAVRYRDQITSSATLEGAILQRDLIRGNYQASDGVGVDGGADEKTNGSQ
ncbi:MAG: UPF0182 family protein [Acidobacteria bacterium]|nr:UPF0182 family protein [Acidobacteriota bacterium]